MPDCYLREIGGLNRERRVMDSLEQVGRAYRTFAPAYDAFLGVVLEPGRRAATRETGLRLGAGVLELDVGTGLSLAWI